MQCQEKELLLRKIDELSVKLDLIEENIQLLLEEDSENYEDVGDFDLSRSLEEVHTQLDPKLD